MTQTTPKELTPRIRDWCLAFAGSEPFYISTGSFPKGFCYLNCAVIAITSPEASIVSGWVIWEAKHILEAEHHSILRMDEEFIDPTEQDEKVVLFVPDVQNAPACFKGKEVHAYHNLIYPSIQTARKQLTVTTIDMEFEAAGPVRLAKEMAARVIQVHSSIPGFDLDKIASTPKPKLTRPARNKRKRMQRKA